MPKKQILEVVERDPFYDNFPPVQHPGMPQFVRDAYDTIDMWKENMRLREEVAELKGYRKLYVQELQNGIKHGEHMMGGFLRLILEGRLNFNPPTEGQPEDKKVDV